jgi:hypothetical protein
MINEKDILDDIQFRRSNIQKEFQRALENKEWSKVSGFDGIDTRLEIAENIIKKSLTKS